MRPRSWGKFLGFLVATLVTKGSLARPQAEQGIAWEPLALLFRGMTVHYEHRVGRAFSLVQGIAFRTRARQDYASRTWGLLLESRFWLEQRERIANLDGIVGPYLALRVGVGRTGVWLRSPERHLGTTWTVEESLRLGYRFVLFELQEITPSLGLVVGHEVDERGHSAWDTRVHPGIGLEVGWIF